nr:hypothetical protein [Tanacetum cinerariifolium]
TSVTPHVDKPKISAVTPLSKKLHASMSSHSVPQPREFNVVNHRNVIAPGMFKINPSQTPRVQNFEIQFPQEAAKFVRDFKSLAKEADESLDKQKYLEIKIERL